MTISPVLLTDRYTHREGPIIISGVQALVRLMLVQADRDRAAGLRTGGFVSGYRGSPLGTLDSAFGTVKQLTDERGIVVKPAVNEEMGATAVAGTQQIDQTPGAKVDGVFALWYGKGPGLDRASDAIRHGNYQGASPAGGVVLAVGDDHIAKSSSIICYSDEVVVSLQVPLFYPSDPGEIVEYGLHGFALSRHTGSWAALKILTEVADSTRTVSADELAKSPVLPAIDVPPMGLHNRWPEMPLEQEARQQDHRLPAVADYVYANELDRIVLKPARARVGFVAAGKAWLDLREALDLLDLDEHRLAECGIALYKPAMIWPLEQRRLAEFAEGLEMIVVVEEKAALVEDQIKSALYGLANAPRIWGKRGPDGATLFPSTGDLTPERVAAGLGPLLAAFDLGNSVAAAGERWRQTFQDVQALAAVPAVRKPFFCSGCPHNRSTVLPEGSRATAGIGCHGLAAYNRPNTSSFAQMGGEGIYWMGLSPFTDESHIFANMGDGTYFHSGLLAIRQAVAADMNITYKLLYNSAVAMTGGQSVDGELSVEQLAQQLRSEGVQTIVMATDDPERYPRDHLVRSVVSRIDHRDDLDTLQRDMREVPGVSVIIYEQMCATEKRRLRKRGKLVDPATRVFINQAVCEGCGDCSAKSNCLSVEPVRTEHGTKRKINQSSCNKDYSCLTGFCPSFVTIEGGTLRKAAAVAAPDPARLPLPPHLDVGNHQRVLVGGVGGTGVVTIGALLSMAAHMKGRRAAVLDQVGMAQKGGAVTSHIHIAEGSIHALRIAAGKADLVIACDQIVGNAKDVMAAIDPGRTYVLANADVSITGDFTQNRSAKPDVTLLTRRMAQRAGEGRFFAFPFSRLSEALLGDAIGSNLMMVGFAFQKGWLALDLEAFDAAITRNGVALDLNFAAFAWGRQLAIDPALVYGPAGMVDLEPETISQLIARLETTLVAYQDRAYADRFLATVARVSEAEAAVRDATKLTEAVAKTLFKLMAYKDEYEVARLYSDRAFADALQAQFETAPKISFHLAPPLLAPRDRTTGELRKRRYGGWVMVLFRILAKAKGLRGSLFDPFGHTSERKMERALIEEYESLVDQILARLSTDRIDDAVALASAAGEIRGYGHVKDRAVNAYRAEMPSRIARYLDDAAPAHPRTHAKAV